MSEFSTTAVIEAQLDSGSVSRIKSQLSEVGPLEVGATASGQLASGAAGGGAAGAASSTLTDGGASDQLTGIAEEQLETLNDIERHLASGGGGGAGLLPLGIGGSLTLAASQFLSVAGSVALSAAKVLSVSGVLGLAASGVLAVAGVIDLTASDIITTTGVLTVGIASVLTVTGALSLGATGVLAVAGTLGLAASAVLAVTGTIALTASNVLSVTGVFTVGAAAALAVTGTLSLPAAGVIAVVGTLTVAAGEVIELLPEGDMPSNQPPSSTPMFNPTAPSQETINQVLENFDGSGTGETPIPVGPDGQLQFGAPSESGPDSETRPNRAKENRQPRSDTNVDVTVNAEGATRPEVEQAMEEAKREAVAEIERKVTRSRREGL